MPTKLIRLPENVLYDLKASAAKNRRSENSEIIFRLENSFKVEAIANGRDQ
ncbi:Arc family DNA-binding protein [Budvicia aquatica]|uniref:Arc family DNA-binding protein n=1 Tax=Budvicia aquatica TaxID=82979 RepID=UPI0035A22415